MLRKVCCSICLLVLSSVAQSWGFHGHKTINQMAVFTLPTELMAFFKANLAYVTDHAVDPDMRRYAIDEEGARHYIDLDHFGPQPFEVIPRNWEEAVAKFTEDTLQAFGIVPWHINLLYYRLVQAYRYRDTEAILRTASDIGHYIADAHVPLHTTENYNGQLTGQHGIHGFWESRLPEVFSGDYDFLVGAARYVEDPLQTIWEALEKSHAAVDSVLIFERLLNEKASSDQKYSHEMRKNVLVKTYSQVYSTAYHQMLDGMVERRMRSSILTVGSFWYSAWIDAGQPELEELPDEVLLEQLELERVELERLRQQSEIKGRAHPD
jgi:hypothetical protein